MKTKKNKQLIDYIKANRKGQREAEIENHDRPIHYNKIYTSKKVYNRKKLRFNDND